MFNMLKFEYRITPVPKKKDIYNLEITKKGWLQIAGFSLLAAVSNYVVTTSLLRALDDDPPLEVTVIDPPAYFLPYE